MHVRLFVAASAVVAVGGCEVDSDVDYVPNEIPTIAVSSPIAGTVFLESEPVPVTVQVSDPDEDDLSVMELEWIMVPAPAGEGPTHASVTGSATFEIPPLPPGHHTITINVFDPLGANATTVATFEVDQDADGDGFSPDTDCDDEVASTNPAAEEICNGVDDDCVEGIDNGVPTTVWFPDLDLDGFGDPTFPEVTCEDLSGEGFVEDYTDCNDRLATTHPGAVEECNGVDDDCLNGVDDGLDFQSWYVDLDRDTYGNPASGISSCDDLSNSRVLDGTDCSDISQILNHDDADLDTIDSCAGDCNDFNADVFPGNVEECDDVDENCFGGIDEGFTRLEWWIDADGDSYGNPATYFLSCTDLSATHIHEGTDCDDTLATLNHDDADGDGVTSCLNDCDDFNGSVFPGQPELCNGLDDNCKGGIDENVVFQNWFLDADQDGAGDPNQFLKECIDLSATHVTNHDDCNDADPAMNVLDEDGDGVDTCEGDCDDTDPTVTLEGNWYVDTDGDTYGGGDFVAFQCHSPGPGTGSDVVGFDCDEIDPLINPGAKEICDDGIDQDCSDADQACGPIGDFQIADGPLFILDPPVLNCLETCAQLFGGVDTDYSCSTDKLVLDYQSFVDGWADSQFCHNPVAQDFKKEQAGNPGYNCMGFQCSYSAYVLDHACQSTNYCWLN